jgi:type IV pilus assembly protein PilY1
MTEFTKRIVTGNDDCRIYNDTTGFSYTGYTVFGFSSVSWDNGFRFTNVTIPQGATISSAKMTFKAINTISDTDCNVRIACVDADNYGGFSDTSGNRPSDVTITTDYTDWTVPVQTAQDVYDTADFTSAVQEVINRASWSSGNALSIVIKDNGSDAGASRNMFTYENTTTECALLTIEYEGDEASFTPKIMMY